jgi:hypothetical protein
LVCLDTSCCYEGKGRTALQFFLHWHGSGRISNCLNRLLQEVLVRAPATILMILFCKVKIFPLLEELPPKVIPYFMKMRACTVNWFESVNVTDMDRRSNGITFSASLRDHLLNMVLPIYVVIQEILCYEFRYITFI